MATISLTYGITEAGNGLKKITGDLLDIKGIASAIAGEFKNFDSAWIKAAAASTALNAMTDSITQLSGTIKSLTGDAAEFGKAMRAANTMAGKDAAGFAQLKKDVTGLAKEVPIARDLLANGLYQVISNGVPEDNWMEFLRG